MVKGRKLGKEILDIGAGDRPYSDATVAVDIMRPQLTSAQKKQLSVAVSGTALDIKQPTKARIPNRLREYWVGDASRMPREWSGRFDTVKSRYAQMAYNDLKEIYRVLQPGGQLQLLAPASTATPPTVENLGYEELQQITPQEINKLWRSPEARLAQKAENKKHSNWMVKRLKQAGFINVCVTSSGSNMTFYAAKPVGRAISRVAARKCSARKHRPSTVAGLGQFLYG